MRLIRMFALAAFAAFAMAGVSPAFAIDIPIGSGARDLNRNNNIQLQILESRERRLDYQNQQQQFRAEDRRQNQARPEQLDVPLVQGSCSVQVRGNRFLRTCR